MTTLPEHSPRGASGAERWINCPGSATLIKTLGAQQTDEPEWQVEGTAAHKALNYLLKRPHLEAYNLASTKIRVGEQRIVLDEDALAAVQVGADACRKHMTDGMKVMLEERISADFHPLFYGTVDFAAVSDSLLVVIDYKHGEGVLVEVEENPQLLYYAYGIYLKHPGVRRIVLKVVQPRHYARKEKPVTRWEISDDDLSHWAGTTLIPAMKRADTDRTFEAGKWCRFCPAKLVCPLQRSIFEAASTYDAAEIKTMDDRTLAACMELAEPAYMFLKALKDETYRRLMDGKKIEGQHLEETDKHRVWHKGAEAELVKHLGEDAFTRELKTPAQIEKLPGGGDLAKRLAYKPPGVLTLAKAGSQKSPIVRKSMTERFAGAISKL